MFTGIVEEMGAVISLEKTLAGTRMTLLASTVMSDLKIGDSVNVNGICLTAISDRKSTRLNSSHIPLSRMPSSA